MERSRWNLRHFPKWCTAWWCWWCWWSGSVTMTAGWSRSCFARLSLWWHPLSRVMVSSALGWGGALLRYFVFPLRRLFLAHSRGWPEKTWENITRVFTREEKAGQTNHLNLYCSTFLCQTFNLFNICFNAVFLGPSFLFCTFKEILLVPVSVGVFQRLSRCI